MGVSQVGRLINWLKEVAVRGSLVKHATKKELLEMMGSTKLHGCYRLYAGKTYGRLFWLFTALSTGVFFVIVLAELTEQYKIGSLDTQVEIVYDYAKPPSITICSHNPVQRNYIEELKRTTAFSDELLVYLFYTFLRPESFLKMDLMDSLIAGERLLQNYTSVYSNFTVDSFVREASFKCEEAFVQCAFEGVIFDCCNERYSTAVLTDLGQCFQFNWSKLSEDFSVSYHFGSVHGFQVMLDYQSYNEINFMSYTGNTIREPFLDNFEPGFRLYIHDSHAVSYVSSEVLVVSPNNKLSAGLKPVKYHFMDRSRGGTCRDVWPSPLRHNLTYSASTCQVACLAKYFVTHCGCVPLQYNILNEGKLCSPMEIFDCISDFRNRTSLVHNNSYSSLCHNCDPECELFVYYTQNSIIHNILITVNEYLKRMKRRYKPRYVRNNLATVHVFFAAKKYKLYSQSTISDLSNYLSKIGSNMGLFFGASVISLFELILVLFKTIWAFASPARAAYLRGKAQQEIERKMRLEEIIKECSVDSGVEQATQTTEIEEAEEEPGISRVRSASVTSTLSWFKRKITPSKMVSPPQPKRKLGQMLSLSLTPEQASTILEAETFVDSIYVPLRRSKLLSPARETGNQRCISVV